MSDSRADPMDELAARARSLFREQFSSDPEILVAAPGRVNLIGEHTDYNLGFVFPVAIDRYIVIAAARATERSVIWSDAFPEPASFDSTETEVQPGWTGLLSSSHQLLLVDKYSPPYVCAEIVSNLPLGSGLSSSAAMGVGFLTVLNSIGSLSIKPEAIAVYGEVAEHCIGVQCGPMDHLASALGKPGQAMLIDTRELTVTYHRLPEEMTIVACATGKNRTLDASAYNQRRQECEDACGALHIVHLRDARLGDLSKLTGKLLKRARHVVTENRRCLDFAIALENQDLPTLGELMKASHDSLRDDYEVSCPELDAMAEAARQAPGCIGARMTGAGFGGACVALVLSDDVERFIRDTKQSYLQAFPGAKPSFLPCRSTWGARLI